MQRRSSTFAAKNNYLVVNVTQARHITKKWLEAHGLDAIVSTGLPEIEGDSFSMFEYMKAAQP